MKKSQFLALVAIMYATPHIHPLAAFAAFIVFGILSVLCMKGED